MKVYILFETDRWLTKSSSTIIAVCTTKKKAIDLCEEIILKRNDISYEDKIYSIGQMIGDNQTQGRLMYNYYIEEYSCNKMILG